MQIKLEENNLSMRCHDESGWQAVCLNNDGMIVMPVIEQPDLKEALNTDKLDLFTTTKILNFMYSVKSGLLNMGVDPKMIQVKYEI